MLHWTHVPEAPDRSLEEQMWRILNDPKPQARRLRHDGVRIGLVVAAAAIPFGASVAWAAAYVLGLGAR